MQHMLRSGLLDFSTEYLTEDGKRNSYNFYARREMSLSPSKALCRVIRQAWRTVSV
jgi:hypothetical protein